MSYMAILAVGCLSRSKVGTELALLLNNLDSQKVIIGWSLQLFLAANSHLIERDSGVSQHFATWMKDSVQSLVFISDNETSTLGK